MPLCTDCRNEAFIVGGADDVYSGELSRPCSRCGWEPEGLYRIWAVDADVEWTDEEIKEFIDGL